MSRSKVYRIGVITLILAQLLSVIGCTQENTRMVSAIANEADTKNEVLNVKTVNTPMELSTLPEKYIPDYNYQEIAYTAQVEEAPLADDFSNVINFNQFTGFTDNQLEMLKENGFVVMQPGEEYPYLKLHQVYEGAQYTKTPVFISTDAVLNLYHIFYSESLKSLEASELNEALNDFTNMMLEDSLAAYNNAEYVSIKTQLAKITAYYGVAKRLLGGTTKLPSEIQNLVDEEYQLIQQAEGVDLSPILEGKLDYSQYIVRGHYTNTDRLTNYFKTMMWYGQVGFEMLDTDGNFDLTNTQIALMMSLLIFNSEEATTCWDRIYTATSIYVGAADDITLYDMQPIIKKVYGEKVGLMSFVDSSKEKDLQREIESLRTPQIQGEIVITEGLATGVQFRVMGQRYTIDGDIMQKLMKPILRPVPSGLDVTAALGSERSKELVQQYDRATKAWEDYLPTLENLQNRVKVLTSKDWEANLYSGWVWTLSSVIKSFEEIDGMPRFMRNKAWTDKSIHTALGSYAELKHDTVLYSKQPVAEMGGPPENMPYIYVEPNVEVYAKLLSLTENTMESLSSRDLLRDEAREVLERIQEDLKIILNCAQKELTNENFTEEEYDRLIAFGGMVDSVSTQLASINMSIDATTTESYTSALISDVATIIDTHQYLELGSGIPYEIYVICPYKGKLFLAKGATFSYYEFVSDTRLTDEEWHKLLGIQKTSNKDYGFEEITTTPPTQGLRDLVPKWTKSFISTEPNRVSSTEVEVIWDDAMLPNNPTPGPDGEYEY